VYVTDAGEYKLEARDANTFVMSNVYVGAISTDKYDYSLSSSGQQKITASGGSSTEYFGRRCAISGDKMIVTASSYNSGQGAAYIFTKSGTSWSQQQRLTVSGLSSSTEPQFGHGADISGNYAIVGAYEEDTDGTNAGGVYIYYFSGGTWTQQARIVSSDIAAGDVFGYAVSIDGDYAIVGAQSADPDDLSNAGASYIFKRSGTSWTQQAKLTASDAAEGDVFGRDVAIKGDYAIVGCYSGEAAYIFKKDTGAETWTQKAILTASDASGTAYFGNSVSMSGDYVIVGAKSNDANKGAAYIFKKDTGAETWTQQAKLIANDVAENDEFGWSVSIDNGLAIVGSLNDDDGSSSSGSAYVFARDGAIWSQQVKLTASDAASNDNFGNSVAIDGDFAVVGARGDESSTGAAYIFQGVKSFPSLTFDGYNKLTIDNVDTIETATIKKDGAAFATTTSNTVYIRNTGTYTAEVKGSNVYAIELSNVVTGSLSTHPGTPLITNFVVTRNNGSDYTDASPYSGNTGFDNIFVDGNTATRELDGHSGSGIGFAMYIHFDQTFTVNTAVFKMISTYSTYKDISFRCGVSESNYITVDPGGQNYSTTQTISFTFSSPITVNKLYFAVNQDGGSDLYNLRLTNGDIIINGIAYPLSDSDKILPPSLTYDNYNKITLENMNYEDTATVSDPNGSTYNIGTAKTMYVKDTGEYVFKISGTDKYVESNVYVSSVDLAGAPTKPIDFDGYNKLTLINAGSNVSANVTYFSNTYELGSANVLYINGAGTYDLEMSGSNVFALSSNVVGTVSQHPTDVVPSLTFDNYNKLTLENFTGSILSDVNSVNASVTKVSGGGTSPDASSINSHVVLSNGDKAYHYNYTNDTNLVRNLFDNNTSTKAHGTSLSAGEYYEWGYEFVSSKKIGSMTFKTWTQGDTVGNISIYYYDGTTWKSVVNPSALGYDLATEPASYAELEITFSPVTATHFKIWVYAHPQSSNSNTPCISEWTLKSYKDGTLTDPNGDTYSLGQTQDTIYIKDQGDYFLEVTNSDQSAVVKTNVGSVSTPDPNQVPLTVTGLSGWYTGSSFNTSNNQWEDISGNDRHMTETQGTMNVDSTGINQKAYVYASRYDGIRLPVTAHSVDNHTPNYTFFFVGKWTADNNIRGRILDNVSAGYFSGWYGRQYSGHSRYISPKNSAQNKTTNNTNITGDDWALVTDFNYGFRINGIDRANNSTIAEGGFTQMGINYGYYNTGTYRQDYQYSEGCSWAGAELICYNRTLTANEISLIEGYLQSKYLISNDIQQVLIPSLTFDTYNKLSIENITPISTSLRLGSNTYEIGTASNVYIEHAGTYKFATGDATTFALVSNVVGTVSQHPEDVVPSLTYDTSNKLSIENLTPTSTTLTDPNGSSFDIGTASNVYIRDSGTYSIASKDANTFLLASNTVTGTPTGTTYVYDSNTFTTPSQTYDTTKTITVKNVPSTLIDVAGKIYKGSTAYTITQQRHRRTLS
jgi:hypothetical protein